MKAKVLKKFKDRETGKIRKPGEVFTLTRKRFDEIGKTLEMVTNTKGWLEEIKEVSKNMKREPKTKR